MGKNVVKLMADDPIKGKVLVGELVDIDGKKYLIKTVSREKHYFKLMQGYAIQRNTFLQYKHRLEGIYIHERDTKKWLYASMETWTINGSNWTGKSGNQQTLSEKYMEETTNPIKGGKNGRV